MNKTFFQLNFKEVLLIVNNIIRSLNIQQCKFTATTKNGMLPKMLLNRLTLFTIYFAATVDIFVNYLINESQKFEQA